MNLQTGIAPRNAISLPTPDIITKIKWWKANDTETKANLNFSLTEILKGSLYDLRRYPIMLVPLLVASIMLFFLLSLLAGAGIIAADSQFDLADPTDILLVAATALLTLAVEFFAFGILVCLAYDAVINEVGDLASGMARFKERFRTLLGIALVYVPIFIAAGALIAIIASLIGSFTIIIAAVPVMLLVLLTLFSPVAAIYDGTGTIDAVRSAWSLVFSNLSSMLIFALIMFLIFMLLGFFSSLLSLTPIIGNILSSLILAAFYSFAVDAGMRIYRQLTNR